MADLDSFRAVLAADGHFVVVATTRPDGTTQASVVNAGVLHHPHAGVPVVGLVARSDTRKVAHLRQRPRAATIARSGGRWVTVEGTAEVVGPDDEAGLDSDALRRLLRDVFIAAGGTHDDWDEYDRVMAAERRAAVLITPDRIYGTG